MNEVLHRSSERNVCFWCPGCKCAHALPVTGQGAWQWNGDMVKPTFTPSVLVTSGHYNPGPDKGECWCTFNAAHPEAPPTPFKCERCHSFVVDGRIQFLADCTHEFAGQTVDMRPWKGYDNDESTGEDKA